MEKIIADFPGYKIVQQPNQIHQCEADTHHGIYEAGDVIGVPYQTERHGTLYNFYTLGSVVSYAREYKECPIEAIDQARERGHSLHWANLNAVSITSSPRKRTYFGEQIGAIIFFEGRHFRLDRDGRDHIKLTEMAVDTVEETGDWAWFTTEEVKKSLAA